MEAGETLGLSPYEIEESFDRVGTRAYSALREGSFKPFRPSKEIRLAFEQNAIKLGLDNPFNEAESAIDSIADELSYVTLDEPVFPSIENPLMPIMEDTPITPTSLNLPSIDVNAVNAQVQKNIRPDLTRQQLFDFLFPQG